MSGIAIFTLALLFAFFQTEQVHTSLLVVFSFAFLLIFVSSYLPRKETKVSSLVTQTGALELLDLSPLPVFTYEERGDGIHIRFANLACHNMLAEGSKSLIGKPINKLVMIEDEEEMMSVCLNTLKSETIGKNHTFHIRSRTPDGKVLKLMCATAKIKWLRQYIGICFLLDISNADNQYISMQEHMHEGQMNALVAGIAHDFRNVLTSIIGSAEALQFNITDAQVNKQLDVIIDAGERGATTITELLSLTSGQKTDENIPYRDISPDLNSITSLLRLQLPTSVKLSCRVEKDLPPIKINMVKLEQILMNLVNNASQAIDKEAGIITIDVIHHNQTVKITISDNGSGISEDNLPFITDNFWTTRKDSGGTGLGLAMVKRIVSHHGGKLEITSQLNLGTQVSILFPTQEQPNITTQDVNESKTDQLGETSSKSISASPFRAKPCTILLVDDQPSVLHVQQMLLEAMGHTVITALNGQAAIAAYEKNEKHIQMLVTDFKMPDMDGIDLAKRLRKTKPSLPLLMVTGYGEKDKLKQADKLNMTIITKPTNLDKFSKAITETQLKHPNIFS